MKLFEITMTASGETWTCGRPEDGVPDTVRSSLAAGVEIMTIRRVSTEDTPKQGTHE